MSLKNLCVIIALIALIISCGAVRAAAQTTAAPQPSEVQLGDVQGAVVTLYYYDTANDSKGAIVPLADNPQDVVWDDNIAAPGTYTFTDVPDGVYYLEAVHDGYSWFAIVTVNDTLGTSTANVAIPPYNDSGFAPSATPAASPTLTPAASPTPGANATAAPSATPGNTSSPGMTTLSALTGLTIVSLYVVYKKK